MKDRKLALRYARALLSALPPGSDRAAVDGFLSSLSQAIDADPAIRDPLLDPAIARDARRRALSSSVQVSRMPSQVGEFLGVLLENGRLGILRAVADTFHELREAEEGVVSATLTTASQLQPDLRERLATSLERITGRRVRLEARVDPAILGGVITQVGSTVYDGSLRSQLGRLKRTLTQE